MLRTFALVSVVAALALAIGCEKSKPSSAVAVKPPVNEAPEVKQETATIEAPLDKPAEATAAVTVDTAAEPAAATIEAPLDKPAEATAAITVDTAVEPAAATIEAPLDKPAEAAAAAPADETADKKSAEIGDQGPAWENLAGTDDKQHSLKDLAEAKAVAVIFTCNTCPVAVAYEERMAELTNKYKDQGVVLVAINVNKDSHNDLAAMKERAEKQGFPYAYLFDPSQEIARAYGATVTPHAFLLDGARKIAYIGAIDDNQNVDAVAQHSLQDAIDAVLAGKPPTVATTKQFGCGIRYE